LLSNEEAERNLRPMILASTVLDVSAMKEKAKKVLGPQLSPTQDEQEFVRVLDAGELAPNSSLIQKPRRSDRFSFRPRY
jgi:hypothetical protein